MEYAANDNSVRVLPAAISPSLRCNGPACTTLGPDFHRPDVPLQDRWMEEHEPQVRSGPEPRLWWTVFRDPVPDRPVRLAYEQNIPLRVAGARIYKARGTTVMAERTDWGRLLQPPALQPPETSRILRPDW